MRKSVALAWMLVVAALAGGTALAQRPSKPAASPTKPSTASAPSAGKPASVPSASKPASKPASQSATAAAERRLLQANIEVVRHFQAGKFEKARQLLLQLSQEFPTNSVVWYNLACAHSRLGDKEQAFKCLEVAVEHGYADLVHLQRDEDIDPLRKDPRYKRLLARRDEIQKNRGEKILAELRKTYGQDYICEIVPEDRLVIATNIDRPTLERVKDRLTLQAEALWRDLFANRFDQYLTVIIPKTDPSQMRGVGGYYSHGPRLLLCKNIGMTLHHEFTHALHAGDQEARGQSHPIWVAEGLATLYESSDIRNGHIVPEPNHRVNYLKYLADPSRKKTIPWSEIMAMDQPKFMAKAAVSYSQVRYMMMFLYEKKVLRAWYEKYAETYATDRTGVLAMELTFDKPLAEIEAAWLSWVRAVDAPPVAVAPNHAYIGVRTAGLTDGLEIAEVVPGSGADKAGLKAKDLIVQIDGEDMVDPGALIMLVNEHKVGDKVRVRYRRSGKYETTEVTLAAMPSASRPPRASTAPRSTSTAPRSTTPARATSPAGRSATAPRGTAPARANSLPRPTSPSAARGTK